MHVRSLRLKNYWSFERVMFRKDTDAEIAMGELVKRAGLSYHF